MITKKFECSIKVLAFILFILLLCGNIFAQHESKLTRKIIYTLSANERIFANEYYAEMGLNGYNFAAIVENMQSQESIFIFNGERIITTSPYTNDKGEAYTSPVSVYDFNPGEKNGYIFAYELAGRVFINVKGKVTPSQHRYSYAVYMDKNKCISRFYD
ncbi:MAG: hypothetical protein LBL90_04585 [Prevotellaceae bacterium]|jgi:hypothetical protein|nr:hypothetical protein [Prevotellaceae bacterium]